MIGPYQASKFLAEQVALGFAHQGLPVVVVNPSAPVGPWDGKPTPTGRMVVDFLEGKMVGTLDHGLNLVHVRDVARGHLLAAERGKIGEKYILGNRNISLAEIGALLSEIAGIRPPRVRIPYWVAWSAPLSMEAVARVTATPPRAPLTAVRMAKKRMYFDPANAGRGLGLPQTAVRHALPDPAASAPAPPNPPAPSPPSLPPPPPPPAGRRFAPSGFSAAGGAGPGPGGGGAPAPRRPGAGSSSAGGRTWRAATSRTRPPPIRSP